MSKRKTPKEYYNECKEKRLDLPIEDYINAKTKINHKCKYGHTYEQTPHNHLNGKGCPYCSGHHSYTPKEYYNLCKEKGLDLPVEDYKGKYTKLHFKCADCGDLYTQRPDAHLYQKQGHQKCYFAHRRIPLESYIKIFRNKGLDLPINDIPSDKRHIMEYKCNVCGNTYKQRVDLHLQGHGCPICNESLGERYIRNYLDKNNIKYISQKKFHDLKDKTYLSYDFYLPKYNTLIEYQGIQHYEPKDYFGGEDRFKEQQLHDKMKKEYAKDNNYKLIELKYTLDTQELVDKYLSRRIK